MNIPGIFGNNCAETVPGICGLDRPGYIYFITDGHAIKIGFSGAPLVRMANLQGANPRELRMLATVAGLESDEKALHRKFSHLALRGEWFGDTTGEIAHHIEALKPKKPSVPVIAAAPVIHPFPCGETSREFGRFLHEDVFNMADHVWNAAYRAWLSLCIVDQPAFEKCEVLQREHKKDLAAFAQRWASPAHVASKGA